METIAALRSFLLAIPLLAKFALFVAIIVGVPSLSRRVGLPAAVGLLLSGIVIGPYVLQIVGQQRPIADFFAELGKLLLMFFAGLEINLQTFSKTRTRSISFGLITTAIPLLLGTLVGLLFSYQLVPAIVLGSLLASHTLLGLPIVDRLGLTQTEPVTVTVGATMFSDTTSLVIFGICVSAFQRGFSASQLTLQLLEIGGFLLVILLGVKYLGAWLLRKVEDDEDAYFILMISIVAVAAYLADTINLPGIVGAFLSGLAINSAVQNKPAKEKLEFFGKSLFIPVFFISIGFLIEPVVFIKSLVDHFALVLGVVGALIVGKWIAAEVAGRAFGYTPAARQTIWSLTLPQVAATLAAALVAFDTVGPGGAHLIDQALLNVILVLMLATSILGPVLTERFAPRLAAEVAAKRA
jgi:Kef-type K+ transport system membrane component KefB